jgi:hypothetical protein
MKISASLLVLATALCAQDTNPHPDGKGDHIKGWQKNLGPGGSGTTGNGINYNGGPVILGTTNIYYIWYGTWDASSIGILTDFANNIGGSPYFNINTSYFDSTGTNVSNLVHYAGSTTDNYSRGKAIGDSDIATIVSSALTSGRLPTDTNGVYFVLTATDVQETSGFTTIYCGWHTYGFLNSKNIKYSFVGNAATQNLGACAAQTGSSPNGNPGADAMASVIAHELEESVTDPNLNAWYDSSGEENADKCAWTFGSIYSASGGGYANMKLGARDFLIQQNWVNASGGYCALSYVAGPDFSIGVSPGSQTVNPGATSGNYTVAVSQQNGFSGTVNFAISGLPAGASVTPNPIPPSTTSSTFAIATTSSVAPGTYTFTITGTSGALTHTATATLVVAKPDFSLSVAPSSQTATVGGATGNYTVTVNPTNGFSSSVTLSVSGLPTGATASDPGSTTSTATFNVTTTASTPPGTYTLTIKGVSGSLTHTTTASLVVTPVGNFTVSLSPPSLSVKRNNSGTYTVTVTPSGGFTGNVTLTVSGVPSRATATLSKTTITGGSGTATLTISAAKNAQLGTVTITVTGTNTTLTNKGTATLTITN